MGLFSKKAKKANPASPSAAADQPGPSHGPSPGLAPHLAPQTHSQPWQSSVGAATYRTQFQPAEYLPPLSGGWNAACHPPPPPPPYQYQQRYPPLVVNQHYYLMAPPGPAPQQTQTGRHALDKLNLGSVVNLANDVLPGSIPSLFDDGLPVWHGYGSELLNQSAALVDRISERFNDVVTLIDRERYGGYEKALFSFQPQPTSKVPGHDTPSPIGTTNEKNLVPKKPKKGHSKDHPKGQTSAGAATVTSGGYFAKVELYANSRLPMHLPPLNLYISTYPLLSLAAHYSERVYDKPKGQERDTHVDADFRSGTKAMVIKSVAMDDMNTIVFAIRGTATFMDWAVNLNMAPTSPTGFLDDPGNFCHAGFLAVARKMIKPVAARLRQLLEENPSRSSYSLLITGHSAGGAIAALLFSHMLSTSKAASSELNLLTGCFRRVHCVTFGTPPVSLLPLQKPDRPEFQKFLFLSFVNEGDPVSRADKAYVRSLLELFATPAPTVPVGTKSKPAPSTLPALVSGCKTAPREKKSKSSLVSTRSVKSAKSTRSSTSPGSQKQKPAGPTWKVPPGTLSCAGRIVVLRSGDPGARLKGKKTVEERLNEGVVAQVATDQQLREVIWGDPVCHVMRLYAGRLQILAIGAVTAQGH
ncbi:Alpha/Beta hydrolase protein [Pleurostoma richardsiae]|uniref:Alpha/Beta hydrolase protein n=1 Tax=Pleurostoma richardsiae TaxID=41990 RepID=A0AA38RFQ7_9PEZI|nr:Alpha/Beta hydrolase protein [Pleurostoma richardsiae]